MPTFRFRAYGAQGQFAQGQLEAGVEADVRDALWARGLTPIDVQQVASSGERWWQRELFPRRRMPLAQLASFARELSVLRTADIPVDVSLRILEEQERGGRNHALLESLLADVRNGMAFSEALHKKPEVFPAEFVSAIRAGEGAGTSAEVLQDLVKLLEARLAVMGHIRSALVYPMILLGIAVLALATIIGVLVPTIAPLFAESNKAMPGAVRFLVALSAHGLEASIASAIAVAFSWLGCRQIIRVNSVRLKVDRMKLQLPFWGGLLAQLEAAKFARSLGTLLKAGVPLMHGLASVRDASGNCYIAEGLGRVWKAVGEGQSLSVSLQRATPFPAVALRLIAVGEEAGRLDAMLHRVAALLDEQTQKTIERLMTLVTPAITLVLALPIAGLILTVMNALLSVNELVAP